MTLTNLQKGVELSNCFQTRRSTTQSIARTKIYKGTVNFKKFKFKNFEIFKKYFKKIIHNHRTGTSHPLYLAGIWGLLKLY